MKKLKDLFILFITFFKIGVITFGGGYAMIAVIERELVERKKWITHEEFLDIIAVAESSPGPIAVNSATFIGYKLNKFFGSLFATLGVALPSFIIIFAISLFFDEFLKIEYVGYAFRGIQAAVVFLIISAGIKMLKNVKKTPLTLILTILTIITLLLLALFSLKFSTVFIILIGGGIGVFIYLLSRAKEKPEKAENVTDKGDEK